MKNLSKYTISAILILYVVLGFAILSPLANTISGNSTLLTFGLSFSFVFFLVTFMASRPLTIHYEGIFYRLEDDEAARTWLLLHSLFTTASQICLIVAVISSMAPLFLVAYGNMFPTIFMLTWMIFLFSVIGLWSLHLIIGMGYRWLCKGTAIGVRAFANFALQNLRNKKDLGVAYMLKALLLLKDYLIHEELELKELNDTIKITRCFIQFQSEIPYDSLQMITQELKKFPSIEHLLKALSTLNRNPKLQWTIHFGITQKTTRRILELMVAIAAIMSGLTFMPEDTRSFLFEILQSIGSVEHIEIIMGFFLLLASFYIVSLTGTYHLNPLEVKKFTLSEPSETGAKT